MEDAALGNVPEPLPSGEEPDVLDELLGDPTTFSFFQAVRLLERANPQRSPVGRFGSAEESVRFTAHAATAFPASEIQSLDSSAGTTRMEINALGVIGPIGTLPLWYTLMVADELRSKRTSLRDFVDMFQHRMISHFYRAWTKPRAAVDFERLESDRVTHLLRALMGLSGDSAVDASPIPQDTLLFYSGLLGSHRRSAIALEQLLADYFGVSVEVEQFVGDWYSVPDESLCRLGFEDDMTTLGQGALVGDEVWDPQIRALIRLGPLSRSQFDGFLPTGRAHEELRQMTRLFAGDEIDFGVLLVLARDDVPACVLGDEGTGSTVQLGWSSWLRTTPFDHDAADAILSL